MRKISLTKLLPLYGHWKNDSNGASVDFTGNTPDQIDTNHGLALLGETLDDGILECKITLKGDIRSSGAMIVFRANGQRQYFAAGLGGWDFAYSIMEGNNLQFTRMSGSGSNANLQENREYKILVMLEGQKANLFVDEVNVITYRNLPLTGGMNVGLFSFKSTESVRFSDFAIEDAKPKAFIVMQFSSPYNEVYRDTIEPLVTEIGFSPIRVDDITQPGIIINDIRNSITESSVIIADISEANPNVYYEVGMSHALDKPTILLAQRGIQLPFDVGPHRCIFYENTIPGRAKLHEALSRRLENLLGLSHTRQNVAV